MGLMPWVAPVQAHEIPSDVTVQAWLAPGADGLHLLLRVPLLSMRDFDWPVTAAGYLDVAGSRPWLRDAAATWLVPYTRVIEGETELGEPVIVGARMSLPSDRSFETWESARARMGDAPLAEGTRVPPEQAYLLVLLRYPIEDPGAAFSLDPEWAHLGVRSATVLRFVTPEGDVRPLRWEGNPGLVRLDPTWWQAAWGFVALGFEHILGGLDHLLFVACLVIPLTRFWALVPVVTAFTVAHSITLLAAAAGMTPGALWFPPLVETLIAASIVFMALENIVRADLARRWGLAFGFGLVHGFGFSFALSESMQFAGAHLVTSLLAFNVGVELGQLAVLAVLVPVLAWFYRRVPRRTAVILLSALIAHTSWHWMTGRGATLLAYEWLWPVFDLAFLAGALRWLALALVAAGAAWLLAGLYARLPAADATAGAAAGAMGAAPNTGGAATPGPHGP